MERIGDHAVNISKVAAELDSKGLSFSEKAQKEIDNLTDALREILEYTTLAYIQNDIRSACKVEPLEQVIDIECDELKEKHVERLRKGECTVEVGFIFNDLIANVQRISDHCSNVAVCILRVNEFEFNTHEYLQNVRSAMNGQFVEDFGNFRSKYNI